MDHKEFEEAARYWTDRDTEAPEDRLMPAGELREAVNAFLSGHDTCALATCADGTPRCTPLEYGWHDGAIWIFSEGGRKFRGLEPTSGRHAAPVSLAVFEPYAGFGKLRSLQVQGEAEVVDPASPEFARAAEAKHIPAERVPKLASMIHLVKVTPLAFDYLDSSLKQRGLATRQHGGPLA